MSDFYGGPSGQAVQGLGNAIVGAGLTVYDKLNQAEATSQYLGAYDAMRKGMTDFDTQIQQSADWQQYGHLAQENDQKLFESIEGTIKNPVAKNRFIQDFTAARATHYESVSRLANQRRIADTYGQTISSLDEIGQQVSGAGYTPTAIAEAESKMKMAHDAGGLLGGYEQYRIDAIASSVRRNIYMGKLEQEAYSTALSKRNIQSGLSYAVDPVNSPNLDEASRRTVAGIVKTTYEDALGKRQKEQDSRDDKMLLSLETMVDQGKYNPSLFANDQAEGKGFSGSKAALYYRTIQDYAERRSKEARDPAAAAGISDPSVYSRMSAETDDMSTSLSDKVNRLMDAYSQGGLTKADYNSLKTRANRPMTEAFAQASRDIQKLATGANAVLDQSELSQAQKMLSDLKNTHNLQEMTPSQVLSEVGKIRSVVEDKAVERAVNEGFKAPTGLFGWGGVKPNENDIASFLYGIQSGEFAGLESTGFIRDALPKLRDQAKTLLGERYHVDTTDATTKFERDGSFVIQTKSGRIFRLTPKNKSSLEIQEATQQ